MAWGGKSYFGAQSWVDFATTRKYLCGEGFRVKTTLESQEYGNNRIDLANISSERSTDPASTDKFVKSGEYRVFQPDAAIMFHDRRQFKICWLDAETGTESSGVDVRAMDRIRPCSLRLTPSPYVGLIMGSPL